MRNTTTTLAILYLALLSWTALGWDRVDDTLLTASALASGAFTLLYWQQTLGHLNPAGRAVLRVQCVLTAVLAQSAASAWTDQDYLGRDLARAILYAALLHALANLTTAVLAHRARR